MRKVQKEEGGFNRGDATTSSELNPADSSRMDSNFKIDSEAVVVENAGTDSSNTDTHSSNRDAHSSNRDALSSNGNPDSITSADHMSSKSIEYEILVVITRKMIFKTRPKPIVVAHENKV